MPVNIIWTTQIVRRTLSFFGVLLLGLLTWACADTRPADTGRPRAGSDQLSTAITLNESDERRARALATWKTLTAGQAVAAPAPDLQPVTATLRALPQGLSAPLQLPQMANPDEKDQSRDETRESLRRFLETAAPLLGIELNEVSLVSVTDNPDGSHRALYQQQPFDFPLRNNFGVVEISYTSNLRVTSLSSTAIPDTDRLRRSLASLRQTLSAEKAAATLANQTIRFNDASGVAQTRSNVAASDVSARQLVVFPVISKTDAATLEFHLAWEINVGSGQGAPLLVYVDAVTGEQLAATPPTT